MIPATLFSLVLTTASYASAQQLLCLPNIHGLAFKMLESNMARGEGASVTGPTGQIQLGLFQQALRESIAFTNDSTQKQDWAAYLQKSTTAAIDLLSNSTADATYPLDRFSIGSAMIRQYEATKDDCLLPAIEALQDSVELQQRNENGGLWYYANPNNLSAYHNLSYADGMFSYPTFAVLSTNRSADGDNFGPAAALKQFQIIFDICKDSYGLVRHGYDASKEHAWADPTTGSSPVVWGRALAWYTLGLVNTLEVLQSLGVADASYHGLKELFITQVREQLRASDRSLQIEGSYGVWQIVDRPGATFAGHENYIEASSTFMTAYSLLKGARLGLIDDADLKQRALSTGLGIYQSTQSQHEFLIRNQNDTLSLNGTSAVATLSGNVDYVYYVTRPTELNSLIGTSAFILAGLEVEKFC